VADVGRRFGDDGRASSADVERESKSGRLETDTRRPLVPNGRLVSGVAGELSANGGKVVDDRGSEVDVVGVFPPAIQLLSNARGHDVDDGRLRAAVGCESSDALSFPSAVVGNCVHDGYPKVDDGRPKVDDGRSKADDGRAKADDGCSLAAAIEFEAERLCQRLRRRWRSTGDVGKQFADGRQLEDDG
jgi:hypothetical protein